MDCSGSDSCVCFEVASVDHHHGQTETRATQICTACMPSSSMLLKPWELKYAWRAVWMRSQRRNQSKQYSSLQYIRQINVATGSTHQQASALWPVLLTRLTHVARQQDDTNAATMTEKGHAEDLSRVVWDATCSLLIITFCASEKTKALVYGGTLSEGARPGLDLE